MPNREWVLHGSHGRVDSDGGTVVIRRMLVSGDVAFMIWRVSVLFFSADCDACWLAPHGDGLL